ncbi:hypothetical protein PBY51_007846 [Eleginops maclovinus]|uniref:Uncharacterized protein n=1 Tax=Eleginops maclovinus TaxID=56733 RepID=A0AAN7X883_ELEMC|nr:hypothetical protein PBY51_007846 [Eleginops maclovinus]
MALCSIPNMVGPGLFWFTNKRDGDWLLLDDYKPCFCGNLILPKNTQYQSNNTPCEALSPLLPGHEYRSMQPMWSDEGHVFVYMCALRYLHANGETRFVRRWSGVRPGRRVRRARRAAEKGETGGKGGNQDYWPERSP